MKPVVSKCGNLCSSCPWGVWIRKGQSEEEWVSFVEDVKKYVGFKPTQNPCHGCQTPTEKLAKDVGVHNFLRGCSARKCAFHNNIRNCAYCSRYPCDKIKTMNVSNSRKDAEKRLGGHIPDAKYEAYVRIFEGMKTLDEIREKLDPDEIKDIKPVEQKPPRITEFPKVETKYKKFEPLHEVLSRIFTAGFDLKDTDTVAGREMLKNRRSLVQRLLWILANYGAIQGDTISVDSITFNIHKKGTSGFPTNEEAWKRWLDVLTKIGILGKLEIVSLEKEHIISPIGWLRDRIPGTDEPVWHLVVSFDEKLGNCDSLKLLMSYTQQLHDEYDKKAYSRFIKADMRLFKTK